MTARFDGPRGGDGAERLGRARPRRVPGINTPIGLDPGTVLEQVQRTGRPARTDSYEEPDGAHAEEVREIGMHAGVGAPIVVDGELWGAVAAGSAGAPFTADAEQRLHAFAELVGQAIANVDAREKLQRVARADRGGGGRGAAQARARPARRRAAAPRRPRDPAAAADPPARRRRPGIEPCIQELLGALEELRDLARGLHPAVLSERGLVPALDALATRSPIPATVDATLAERLPEPQEVAIYFVAAEALANVAKYARRHARRCPRPRHRRRRLARDRRRRRRRRQPGRRKRPTRARATASRRSAGVCASRARPVSAPRSAPSSRCSASERPARARPRPSRPGRA